MNKALVWTSIVLLGCVTTASAQQEQNQQEQQQQPREPATGHVVKASLEQGQTIMLPSGSDLLELTVAVPQEVHAGQRYQYMARVRNNSDNIMLTNVRLKQVGANKLDIESAEVKSASQQQTTDRQQAQRRQQRQQAQQNQQNQEQAQTGAQGQQPAEGEQQKPNQDQQQASNQQGKDGTWRLGRLKPGDAKILTVTAVASEAGRLDHCFSVQYDESLCTTLEVIKPQITITKWGPERVTLCQPFEYQYEVTNSGTGTAKDFIVRDELPEGVVTEEGDRTLEFRVTELPEGESKAYLAKVHAMKEGELASRAVVEQQSGQRHESSRVVTQVVRPELQVELQGPRTMRAGDGGQFHVIVRNESDIPAQDVYLYLTPEQGLQFTRAGNGDAREGGKSYRYSLGDLDPQQEESISVNVDAQSEGDVLLKAKAVSLCAHNPEMLVAEAETQLKARMMRLTSLAFTMIDKDDVIPIGDPITYEVQVINQGDNPDENVQVELEVPEGMKVEQVEGPGKAQVNGQKVTIDTAETLEAGQRWVWNLTAISEAAGEKVVKGTLTSQELESAIETEEASTFFDASQQQSQQSESSSQQSEQQQAEQQEAEQQEAQQEEQQQQEDSEDNSDDDS